MSLQHQDRGLLENVQHDEAGGEAGLCDAEHSLSFESTSPCTSRATSSRRGSRKTSSELNDGKADNLTLTTHSRQGRQDKLYKVHILKGGNGGDSRYRQQEDSQTANCRLSFLPPIKPHEGPMQHTSSACRHPIKRLGSQEWDAQHQPAAAPTEKRPIKCLDGCQGVALQHLKNWENNLVPPQQNDAMRTLQELLQDAWDRNRVLVRQLHVSKARLLSIRDALWTLQQLSQDRSLGETEKLVQHVYALTLELDIKNRRIEDLEKTLELTNASFNCHLSSQVQKTHQARDLSKSLQEEINQLKQKIREQVQLLEMRNIYSYEFSERNPGKAAKESKSVQTEQLCPVDEEVGTSTEEAERKSSRDVEMTPRKHKSTYICNEQSYNTQVPATGYTEIKNNESTAEHQPIVGHTTHENTSVETDADDGKTKCIDSIEKEHEVLLHFLENHTKAEGRKKGIKTQGEYTKLWQGNEPEVTEKEASSMMYRPQRPSSTTLLTRRSPSLLKRHRYTCKDTIQNLHFRNLTYSTPGWDPLRNCITYSEGHIQSCHLEMEACKPHFLRLSQSDLAGGGGEWQGGGEKLDEGTFW